MSAPKWVSDLRYGKDRKGGKGPLKPTLANAVTLLANEDAWRDVLAFDEFSQRVVTLTAPRWHAHDAPTLTNVGDWTDADDARVVAWLEREREITLSVALAHEAVRIVASGRTIHPVRDLVRETRWDGRKRLDGLLPDYFGAADNPFSRAVGAKWMLSAVARIFRPGCQADHVLVLVGPQGAGKSSALRILSVKPEWYADELDMSTKDGAIALAGRWIVELAELASLSRAETETIKAFLTRTTDKFRPPYGRATVEQPRQCVFAATTNAEEFLKDDTGNRRFWPVKVGKVDLAALTRDRDQLWAEAFARFERGEAWHLTAAKLVARATAEQETRLVGDPWRPIVESWLRGEETRGVTTNDVLANALRFDSARIGRPEEMRAATVLRACTWRTCGKKHPRKHNTADATRVRLYFPAADGCLACAKRWAVGTRERGVREKKVGQVGQVGQPPDAQRESPTDLVRRKVGQVGQLRGSTSSPARPRSQRSALRARNGVEGHDALDVEATEATRPADRLPNGTSNGKRALARAETRR